MEDPTSHYDSNLLSRGYTQICSLVSQENTHLDRDIILNIDLKQERVLTYTLVEKQAIMVSLVPTLELCDSNNKSGRLNCEYIFIVDCSGSMDEENKIGYARQAMSIFLKSLPIGSYFNIIQFGSEYKQFKNDRITIEYNEQTAKEANDYIAQMKADLGGTELYSVLSHLHRTPPQTNYSRQIFLLTDGEIENVDEVLRLCHSISNTTRIFSFGLGSSPSRALVKGLARVTNGSYLFIPPKTHVDVAVARQVDKALEPCLVNMKVQCHFNNNELKDYRISPKILPPIHAKQRLNVYIMMPKIIDGTLSGSIDFLTDKDQLLERVTLTETELSSSLIATRLAAKSIITDLQMDDYHSNSSRQVRFTQQQEVDKKQELIDISIQHQILSPFTAFIGIETRTEEEKASNNEMILREVPIEIRTNESISNENRLYSGFGHFDAEESDERKCATVLYRRAVCMSYRCKRESASPRNKRMLRSRSRSRSQSRSQSRSRSRSPRSSKKQDAIDNSPSDTIRQIIDLQKFNGLWSNNNRDEIISFLQQNSTSKNVDLKKIIHDYRDQDQDIILSMIIMFIFMKYFTADESLWKPIIKKCTKTMENQLGKKEYNEITDKIKQVV